MVVRLAAPAIVRAVNIDTSFFTGNFPPHASVEAATIMGYPSPAEVLAAEWTPLLGGRVNLAASLNGASVSGCSNMFYSSPLNPRRRHLPPPAQRHRPRTPAPGHDRPLGATAPAPGARSSRPERVLHLTAARSPGP